MLSLGMAVIFLGLGSLFLFTNTWIDKYPKPTRFYIGLVLAGWALFRGVSVWMRLRRMKEEEREDEFS